MTNSYLVIYERGDDGTVSAYAPELQPGAVLSTGRDYNEARSMIAEAITLYLEEMRNSGQSILPLPFAPKSWKSPDDACSKPPAILPHRRRHPDPPLLQRRREKSASTSNAVSRQTPAAARRSARDPGNPAPLVCATPPRRCGSRHIPSLGPLRPPPII